MTVIPSRVLTPDEALEAARELAPRLRDRAEATEAARQVSRETIADLIDTGLFGIGTPHQWGGSDLGYESGSATAEIAAACPATGWVYGVRWALLAGCAGLRYKGLRRPRSLAASLFRLRARLAVGRLSL